MGNVEFLKRSRIDLHEIVEEDWQTVHSYASIPAVSQYQPWGPNTEEQLRGYVNQIIREALHQPRTRYAFGMLWIEGIISFQV
ncbi:MAG: hypothetical protein WAM07_10430 [Halobacillus sp.]|uniref:hypothetical protein n=1 Tax=Halobacillus sp. TaxID=56800 RepID=UPI003BAED56A